MSQIYNFGRDNFHIVGHVDAKGNHKQSMCLKVGGIILVLFKIQGCTGCASIEPIFRSFANRDNRVSYGIVDLTREKQIVQMSRATTTVIQTVPRIIIYTEGKPFAVFTGEKSQRGIQTFIDNILEQYKPPQRQVYPQQAPPPQQSFVPQNMYGGPQTDSPAFMPASQPPRRAMGIATNHGGMAHPSMNQQCDSDDEDCLLMPEQIIPHNMPWESDYKKLTGTI